MIKIIQKIVLSLLCASMFTQLQCHDQIIQISLIKTGSFLLSKCLNFLTGRFAMDWDQPFLPNDKHYNVTHEELIRMTSMQPESFWFSHLYHTKEREEYFNKDHFIKIFIYRDPRDQMISFAYFMYKYNQVWPKVKELSFDEILMSMITEASIYDNHPPAKNVFDMYQFYLPWMQAPGFLTIRFEDLIGEKGGGSSEKQIETIKKIANHLKLTLPDEYIVYTAENIFGNSATFREGQIGAWKKHFKPEHIKAFKENAGDLLIEL